MDVVLVVPVGDLRNDPGHGGEHGDADPEPDRHVVRPEALGWEASTVSSGSMPGGAVCVLIAAVTLVDGPTVTHVHSYAETTNAVVEERGRGEQWAVAGDDIRVAEHGTEWRVPVSVVAGSFVPPRSDVEVRVGMCLVARRSAEVAPSARRHLEVDARDRSALARVLATLGALAVGVVTDRSIATDPRAYHSPSVETADGSTLIGRSGSPSAGAVVADGEAGVEIDTDGVGESGERGVGQRDVASRRALGSDLLVDEVGAVAPS